MSEDRAAANRGTDDHSSDRGGHKVTPKAKRSTQGSDRDLGALVIPAVLVVIGGFLVSGILTMDEAGEGGAFGPKTFPAIVATLCFVVAALMAVSILRSSGAAIESADPGDEADLILDADAPAPEGSNWQAVSIVVGGVILFIVMLQPIGWLISATVLFVIVSYGLGARNLVASLLGGLGMAALIQLAFSALLGIHIPPGILG